jgi:hypothetical protein
MKEKGGWTEKSGQREADAKQGGHLTFISITVGPDYSLNKEQM